MNYADAIYRRSLSLPDPAAREALDFIDFLLQRYGSSPPSGQVVTPQRDARAFLAAVAGSWGSDVPDDIDDADLAPDSPRDPL